MRYVVERFVPGVTRDAARATMESLRSTSRRLAGEGLPISYLGGTYVDADESMTCRFEGTCEAVNVAHQQAGVTFDRILESMDVEADPETTTSSQSTSPPPNPSLKEKQP